MKGPALSTLRRFLACIPNIRILDLDINVTLRVSNIVEVDDTLLPNTVFQKLESLSLKTNLRGTEVCSDDFIARQPSLIELRDLLSSRQLIGTSPMLQGLCFRRAFQLPDVPSLESLRSLTNLRLSITGFPSNGWGRLASDLPLLSCVEVCVFLENKRPTRSNKMRSSTSRSLSPRPVHTPTWSDKPNRDKRFSTRWRRMVSFNPLLLTESSLVHCVP